MVTIYKRNKTKLQRNR